MEKPKEEIDADANEIVAICIAYHLYERGDLKAKQLTGYKNDLVHGFDPHSTYDTVGKFENVIKNL